MNITLMLLLLLVTSSIAEGDKEVVEGSGQEEEEVEGSGQEVEEVEGSGKEEVEPETFLQMPGPTADEEAYFGLDPAKQARRKARLFGVLSGIKFGGVDAAGSLAASNSFSIFGKPVNYAFSLAYGPTLTGTGTGTATGTGTPTGTGTGTGGTFTGTFNDASADNPQGSNATKKKKNKNKKQPNKPKRKKKLTPQEKAQRQRKNFLEEHEKVAQRQNNRRG